MILGEWTVPCAWWPPPRTVRPTAPRHRTSMKLEYSGRFFRIVVELSGQAPRFSPHWLDSGKEGEAIRRRVLRKIIHKPRETTP